jgi:hypothetical protein
MKKIKWQDVKSQHDNDCWAIAISKAVGKTYKEIYNLFKPFIDKEGFLNNNHTIAYLEDNGFTKVSLNNQTVKEVLQKNDSVNNHLVFRYTNADESGHIFYVHKDTIFDNEDIEYRGHTYDREVDYIMYKPI